MEHSVSEDSVARHTPGPWSTFDQLDKSLQITAPGTTMWGMDRLEIEILDDDCSHNTALANMILASAAPDFFDACTRLVPLLEQQMVTCCGLSDEGHEEACPLQAVKAAIKKATTLPDGFEFDEDDDTEAAS